MAWCVGSGLTAAQLWGHPGTQLWESGHGFPSPTAQPAQAGDRRPPRLWPQGETGGPPLEENPAQERPWAPRGVTRLDQVEAGAGGEKRKDVTADNPGAGRATAKRPKRWDIQEVAAPRRGQAAVARQAAGAIGDGGAEGLAILEALERDKVAPTTRGVKASKKKLVEDLIIRADGGPYPLTTHRVKCAAASLKHAGYRGAAGYLGEAKQGHILEGNAWTVQLALELKDSVRSCLRGIGPPERAPEVRAALAAKMEDAVYATGVKNGPRRPRRAWVVALWWFLREIELAALSIHGSSVKVWDMRGRKRVTLYLPMSKMDQRGRGAARTWSCLCGSGTKADCVVPVEDNFCPVCTVSKQIDEMETISGISRTDDAARTVPLFATEAGGAPEKRATVEAWDHLVGEAAARGVEPGDKAEDFGEYLGVDGHSPRRSAAKMLIRMGWTREAVAWLGRWGSDALLCYIEEVTAADEAYGPEGFQPALRKAEPAGPEAVVAAEDRAAPAHQDRADAELEARDLRWRRSGRNDGPREWTSKTASSAWRRRWRRSRWRTRSGGQWRRWSTGPSRGPGRAPWGGWKSRRSLRWRTCRGHWRTWSARPPPRRRRRCRAS